MSGWVSGDRLLTRGHAWTLLETERGTDCTALHLAREVEPRVTATLLSPFDRFLGGGRLAVPGVLRPRQWLERVRLLGATSHPAGSLRSLPAAHLELMAHQLEPALAVVRFGATRLLIADAVGLGKTIQAGLIAAELAARSPSMRALILVPAGLRDQWSRELASHFGLSCTRADASWLTNTAADTPAGVNPWALPGVFLASFDFVKRAEVLRPLEDVAWDLFVLDEAHAASTHSDRRAAAHALATRSRIIVLLTATPSAGDPGEYDALCNIGRIDGREDPVVVFRRSQADIGVHSHRKSRLLLVRPSEAEERMHHLLEEYTRRIWRESTGRGDPRARLAAIVLRKRALSSAASLAVSVRRRMELLISPPAPQIEQLRLPIWDEDPLEDEAPVSALAAPGLANATAERRWLSVIAEAAQRAAASETKVQFLARMLRRIREPVIVFTEYRDTLLRLQRALSDASRTVRLLHGGMRPEERTRVQQEFNRGGMVLLATDAASEGLNLHERCRTVIHFELPWSTSRLEQRAGRVDRLGQQRRVHETGFVSATIAERFVLGPLMRRAVRVRATGTRTGLPAAFADSHVAEMIMGDRPAEPVDVEIAPPQRGVNGIQGASLTAAALEEMKRAKLVRSLLGPELDSGPAHQLHRLAATSIRRRRSSLPAGLILVYLLTLSSRVTRLHAEPIVLWLPYGSGDGTRTSAGQAPHPLTAEAVRRTIQAMLPHASNRVMKVVGQHVEQALDRTVQIQRIVDGKWRRRDELVQTARVSAARQLVQQGLFERRGPRTPIAPAAGTFLPQDDSAAARCTILSIDVQLAAALLVLDR